MLCDFASSKISAKLEATEACLPFTFLFRMAKAMRAMRKGMKKAAAAPAPKAMRRAMKAK